MDTTSPWTPHHHWAAMALHATTAEQLADRSWRTRVLAVLDPAVMHGSPERVARRVAVLLGRMHDQPVGERPRWDAGAQVLTATSIAGPGDVALTDLPALVAGQPSDASLVSLLLGFQASSPVLGLVAVQRGYLSAVEVAAPGEPPGLAYVWRPGGPNWPLEGAGQAVLAAFACDAATGHSVVLGTRASTPDHPLTPEQEQVAVDLEGGGRPLGHLALSDNAPVVLAAACGLGLRVPDTAELAMFAPGWLVGRWWLHHTLARLEEAATATDDGPVPVAVEDPPRALAESWAAVRADQQGPRVLGQLLDDDEARLLPERLLAEVCLSRSPSQRWLWARLAELLEPENAAVLASLREEWARWPELAEPDRFVGQHLSPADEPNSAD